MTENFTKLKKETNIRVQKAQRVPNKMNTDRPTPRHIIIKMAKVKQRIRKTAIEKQRVSYKGNSINRFLYRNFAGQKGMAKYILSSEREKHAI